jgi:hypothetical protein
MAARWALTAGDSSGAAVLVVLGFDRNIDLRRCVADDTVEVDFIDAVSGDVVFSEMEEV